MYRINTLNPENFEPFQLKNQTSSMLYDFCNFLGIPIKFDDSSNLCEFKLKNILLTTNIQKGVSHDFPKNYGDQNDIKQLLAINWKYLADNRDKKLIITSKIPTTFTNFIKPLNHIIQKYKLFDRVFWLGLNPLEAKHQSYCDFKILHLNPWTLVYLENHLKSQYLDINNTIEQSSLNDATCHFVSLCARKKFFRSYGTFLLYKKNLHTKGLYSYLGWKGETKFEKEELLNRKSEIISHGISFDELFNFVTKHNKSLDFKEHPIDYKINYNAPGDLNKKGLINLIHESTGSNKEIFITEKIMHCFSKGRPFLLLGNPNSLKYLRDEWGFKTFDFLFDESYDSEIDQILRVKKVIQQLEYFCGKSFEYQKELISEHQHILDHNYKIASSFPHKKLFLELMEKLNV